jgi:hypothetical protein
MKEASLAGSFDSRIDQLGDLLIAWIALYVSFETCCCPDIQIRTGTLYCKNSRASELLVPCA